MRKNKTWTVNLFDRPVGVSVITSELSQNDEFWTNDTDAYLNFKPNNDAYDFDSAELTLYNKTDGSLVVKPADKENGVAVYEMEPEVIAHFGQWTVQVRFIKGEESSTSSIIEFEVKRALGDGIPERLTVMQSWDTFFTHAQETIALMEEAELERAQSEAQRQSEFQENESERQNIFQTEEQKRQAEFERNEVQRDNIIANLDSGRNYHVKLEVADGLPRLRLKEV